MKTFNTAAELIESDEYKAKETFTCRIPFAEYRKAPGYSQSGIKDFLKSPALYKIRQTEPMEATKAMILGSYFDARITGDGIENYAVINADMRTTVGNQLKELAEQAGKTIINGGDADDVSRWIESVNLCKEAEAYMVGEFQVCGFAWLDGIPVKGRADILGSDFIADLKLVADASPAEFSKSIVDRYDIQAGLYQMIFGEMPFIFICQEKHGFKPTPAFTGVYEIDPLGLSDAKEIIKSTLADMVHAEFIDDYSGYGRQMLTAKWGRK